MVDNPEKIAALASDKCTYGFEYYIKTIAKAPAVVLLTIVEGRSGFEKDGSFSTPKEDRWQNFDAGIAGTDFLPGSLRKGLGSVILGYFDDAEVKKVIPIPEGQQGRRDDSDRFSCQRGRSRHRRERMSTHC